MNLVPKYWTFSREIEHINSEQFCFMRRCKISGHFHDFARHLVNKSWTVSPKVELLTGLLVVIDTCTVTRTNVIKQNKATCVLIKPPFLQALLRAELRSKCPSCYSSIEVRVPRGWRVRPWNLFSYRAVTWSSGSVLTISDNQCLFSCG